MTLKRYEIGCELMLITGNRRLWAFDWHR